jgi:hypothetical protein
MIRRRWMGSAGVMGCVLAACGSSDASLASFDENNGAKDPGAAAGPADDAGVPAEREEESSYESPVATGRYVWVANPKSGRVAYIDATTLEVKTVEAGNAPTHVAAVKGAQEDSAIVLNVLSDDATLLRASSAGVTARTFKTAHGMNAWATSADGRWAIAWTDATRKAKPDKSEGFQDLTVIDLTGQVAPAILAVGYRPVSVGFTVPSARAYAVTQDGISIVDLTSGAPSVLRNIAVSDSPLEDPGTRDVSVTPDGAYALIRRDNRADISVVSLADGQRSTVTLDGPVTDLDLSDQGDKALAVVRQSATVAILPVPAIFANPTAFTTIAITGETIGSVSLAPGGGTGLLYTNAIPTERITVLSTTATPTYRTVKLYSPVLAVFASADASSAVVLHDKPAGTTTKLGAFSIVPLATTLPAKIVGTDAPPVAVAIAPTNDRAVIAERSDAARIYGVYLGRMPSLMVDRYPLASPPIAVGIVAGARRAYVAQQHPEGRITFIDLDTGQARTLTGFELAARVVDGSKP